MTFLDELNDAFPLYNDENDVGFLLELLHFFPMDKVYISTGSYDQYLYDLEKTVIDNYESGNYQVSFFYAHLIFMSYVYYCVERVYSIFPERTRDVYFPINAYRGQDEDGKKTGKPDLDNYRSVYDFSAIPEKDIFKIFHAAGMSDDVIKGFGKYINKRDNFAHATGKGNISEETLAQNIQSICGYMETLNELFLSSVKESYTQYLLERTEYECDSIMESAADYAYDNNLSIREIEYLCNLGLRKMQDDKGLPKTVYKQIRKEHCAFIEFCIENYGIDEPDGYSELRDEAFLHYRYKEKADEYVENELGISAYECGKHGGDFPVYDCPECGEEQLAYNAGQEKYHCFSCGKDFTTDDLIFCERCGALIQRDGKLPICESCIEDIEKE